MDRIQKSEDTRYVKKESKRSKANDKRKDSAFKVNSNSEL